MAQDIDNTYLVINDPAIDTEYERYKDWDMSNAAPANRNPMIKKLQDNARLAQINQKPVANIGLDDDITNWLIQQNVETKRQVNELIRHIIAMQNAMQKMAKPYPNSEMADLA